jgi:cytochrome c
VKALLAERDIPYATGEIDADGNSVVRSGRQVMAEAEANIQKAKQDGAGIEAAVSCFLTRGFDAP